MEWIVNGLGYAIAYPLVGMVLMIAGWSIGEVVMKQELKGFHGIFVSYLHVAGLGFAVHVVVEMWCGR